MYNEWTWPLGTWFCGGNGSVMLTARTDDLKGLFKPKSFHISIKIFLFSQGTRYQVKTTVPVLTQRIMWAFFHLKIKVNAVITRKKADSFSFNSVCPPISLLAVTWPCSNCLRSLLVPVCIWLSGIKAGNRRHKWNFFKHSHYQDGFK